MHLFVFPMMAFEFHPGLAALHAAITGQEPAVQEAIEEKKELEEIVKEFADDAKVERTEPVLEKPLHSWRGFGN